MFKRILIYVIHILIRINKRILIYDSFIITLIRIENILKTYIYITIFKRIVLHGRRIVYYSYYQ